MPRTCLQRTLIAALVAGLACAAGSGPSQAANPPEWSQPIKPFRIEPHVYYVGSKGLAAYLITSSKGAVLIDGTIAANAPLIERNIQAVGVPLNAVKLILSDHAHHDHVGAVARIQRDTGAKFAASAGDAWALSHGMPRGDTDYAPTPFAPIRIDQIVKDGQAVGVGGAVLTAHLTPGHTPGCTSWSLASRGDDGRPLDTLFLCSITVAGNILVGNRAYPTIAADYEATFAKLAHMHPDIVLSSHPGIADVLGREARVKAGDKDAFIDPGELTVIVARAKAAFEGELAKASRQGPPAALR